MRRLGPAGLRGTVSAVTEGALVPARRAIAEGLFLGPLAELDQLRLAASSCASCSEVSFGLNDRCPNCGADDPAPLALEPAGVLATFSAIRHRPPGEYRGPDPFKPFGVGLIEFAEGVSVVGPLAAPIELLEIGLPVRFMPHVLYRDEDGTEVVAFQFALARD